MREIDAAIRAANNQSEDKIIKMLQYLGEKCVIEARDRRPELSWNDQTGNLRSSIGYVIVVGGEIRITAGFSQVLNGGEGVNEGKNKAIEIASKHTKGYALIVVAGMEYASYVEDMENKVVLASAELLARRELPNMIKQIFG